MTLEKNKSCDALHYWLTKPGWKVGEGGTSLLVGEDRIAFVLGQKGRSARKSWFHDWDYILTTKTIEGWACDCAQDGNALCGCMSLTSLHFPWLGGCCGKPKCQRKMKIEEYWVATLEMPLVAKCSTFHNHRLSTHTTGTEKAEWHLWLPLAITLSN